MPTAIEELQSLQKKHIRKALGGSVFLGTEDAPLITAITTAGGDLVALDAAYEDAGYMSPDAVQMPENMTTSDVESFGRLESTRTDVTGDSLQITFTMQETKRLSLAMFNNLDPNTLVVDAASGELVIPKAQRETQRRYRGLVLMVDETPDGAIYMARNLPSLTRSGKEPPTFSEEIGWTVTLDAKTDDDAGYASAWHFGGPGWIALLESMGFTALAP